MAEKKAANHRDKARQRKSLEPQLAMLDFMAKLFKRFDIAAHVANRRDPVRQKERKNKFPAAAWFTSAGEMNMHVNEPGS